MKSIWDNHYLTRDNFLSQEDKEYTLDFIQNNDYSKFKSRVGNYPIQVCLDEKIPEKIRSDFQKIAFKYQPKLVKYLKKISPEKVHLLDYCKFKIIISPPGFKEKVHIDDFRKLLTAVVFLHPNKNYGTFLHESKKDKKPKEVEWKQNRCIIMGNKYNKSWHSYSSQRDKFRYVAIITLHTHKIYSHMFIDLNFIQFLFFTFHRLFAKQIYLPFKHLIKKLLFNRFVR